MAAAHMNPRRSQVVQYLGMVTSTVLQGVGEDAKAVRVQLP
jgi:hypothetical protein